MSEKFRPDFKRATLLSDSPVLSERGIRATCVPVASAYLFGWEMEFAIECWEEYFRGRLERFPKRRKWKKDGILPAEFCEFAKAAGYRAIDSRSAYGEQEWNFRNCREVRVLRNLRKAGETGKFFICNRNHAWAIDDCHVVDPNLSRIGTRGSQRVIEILYEIVQKEELSKEEILDRMRNARETAYELRDEKIVIERKS